MKTYITIFFLLVITAVTFGQKISYSTSNSPNYFNVIYTYPEGIHDFEKMKTECGKFLYSQGFKDYEFNDHTTDSVVLSLQDHSDIYNRCVGIYWLGNRIELLISFFRWDGQDFDTYEANYYPARYRKIGEILDKIIREKCKVKG